MGLDKIASLWKIFGWLDVGLAGFNILLMAALTHAGVPIPTITFVTTGLMIVAAWWCFKAEEKCNELLKEDSKSDIRK